MPRRFDWNLLAIALTVVATVIWLCTGIAMAARVDGEHPTGTGTWITAAAAIVAVYYWRHRIVVHTKDAPRFKNLLFLLLLLTLLPYIYLFSGFVEDEFRKPVSKWIGDPAWLYLVPTAFFLLFDSRRTKTTWMTIARYCLELTVVLPLWTYCWFVLQWMLGWWTMP